MGIKGAGPITISSFRYSAFLSVVLMLSMVLICTLLSEPARAAEDPVRIGGTLGLTGRYAAFADMQLKGFRLWEEDVNSRGGMLGRRVEVIILDDESDPEKAVELYDQLIHRDEVDFLFAPFSSVITEDILPLVTRHGYPLLISGASADSLWEHNYPGMFGLFLPASRMTTGFLELLVMHGLQNVAIVSAGDTFSQDIASGSQKWSEVLGLHIVLFEPLEIKNKENVDRLADSVIRKGADAVLVCGYLDEAVDFRLALDQAGEYKGLFYTPVGPGLPEFYKRLGRRSEQVFSTSQWALHGHESIPGSKEFHEIFKDRYKEEPSYFAATAFASGQLLETAVQRTGSLDRSLVIEMLGKMNASSIIGSYGVDSKGIQIRNFNFIVQVQDGHPEVVWPDSFVTKPPVFPHETVLQKNK